MCKTCAFLNSRPLYAMSSNPTEYEAFLIGQSLLAVYEYNFIDVNIFIFKLTRWKLIQKSPQ